MVPELFGAPEKAPKDFTRVLVPRALCLSSFLCILAAFPRDKQKPGPASPFVCVCVWRARLRLDKISHTHSERLRTLSPRGCPFTQGETLPGPTPPQRRWKRIYQTSPGHLEWKTFIPLLEGKAEAGSVWEGGEGEGPCRVCEQSCRGQGPSPGHWLSSRKKSL